MRVKAAAVSKLVVDSPSQSCMRRFGWLEFIAAVVAASCADPTISGSGPTTGTPSVSATGSAESFRAFIPPTQTEGDRVVLPVVFPDGTTAELVYPPELNLAGLGVRPYWAGCGHDLVFYHYDPYGTLYEGEPLQSWTGPDGQTVSVWNAVDKELGVDGVPIVYLTFHFGEWTVSAFDYGGSAAMSDSARRACAMGLSAFVTAEGWIVLSGPPEIEVDGVEPELQFGGLGQNDPFVLLLAGRCQPEFDDNEELPTIGGVPVSLTKDFASWCHHGEMMRIHVYFTGEPTFVHQLVRNLDVRDVHLAA
jgi:hypothetical protein